MDLDGLELKLHEVHFAVKFSEAEALDSVDLKMDLAGLEPESVKSPSLHSAT